jgi:hypothetical protein
MAEESQKSLHRMIAREPKLPIATAAVMIDLPHTTSSLFYELLTVATPAIDREHAADIVRQLKRVVVTSM